MPATQYLQNVTWTNWVNLSTTTATYNNSGIWGRWVGIDPGTTSAGTIYYDTWTQWNGASNTVTNYRVLNDIWNEWVQPYQYRAQPLYQPAPAWRETRGVPAVVRSEEEWTVIREEQERQRKLRDELQREAREEARKLMRVVLTAEQVAMYEERGYFEVRGSEGGLFRIYHGTSGNLKQVVDGKEINALCVHPRLTDHRTYEGEGTGYLPTEDSMIAQAFALMHDELSVVQTANVHRGPRHLRAVPDLAAA